MFTNRKVALAAAIFAACGVSRVDATENGTQQYPVGVNSLADGFLPAPGSLQYYDYLQWSNADHQNDGHGNRVGTPFRLLAVANAFRFMYTWTPDIGPFHYATGIVLPIVYLDLKVAGMHGSDFNAGNVDIQNYLGASNASHTFFYFFGLDTYVPSGHYDHDALISTGANYYTFAPNLNVSYVPNERWDLSAVFFAQFNTTNQANSYHSGDAVNIDYGITYRPFVSVERLGIGVNGYFYKQISNDTQYGQNVGPDGNRGLAISVGPMIRYDIDHGGFALKWQPEFEVKNRPVGNAIWFQFSMPLT
jgi:hypothetical protein